MKHGAHWRIFQNAKLHSTAPSPRPVHLAVSNWSDHIGQVHHGALSLAAHVLPIIGPPLHDHEELETTPKDERENHFWQVRANALSVDVPVCFPGEPPKMIDDHGPTPKRYKTETPLNTAYIQTPASCRSISSMCLMRITGTKPHGTWRFNPP